MTAVAEQPTKKAKKKAQDINLSDAAVDELVTETAVPVEDKAEDKPEPRPGDADFDWQTEYPGEKVFTYTTPSGTTTRHGEPYENVIVGLAAISEKRQPDFDFLRVTRKRPEFEQIMDMLEDVVASEAALNVLGPFRTDLIVEMWSEWSDWNQAQGK